MTTVALNLKAARARSGLLQDELARKASVGLSTITAIESGLTPSPQAATLQSLAVALDTTVEILLGSMPAIPVPASPGSGTAPPHPEP